MPGYNFSNKKILAVFVDTPNLFSVGPYQTTGGWWCPIYIDMRKVFTDPLHIEIIRDEIIKIIKKKKINFHSVVGAATAGIPIATALALKLKKPFCYVRKEKKKGGLGVAVEGAWPAFPKSSTVLLVDDACANGTSKKMFIKNIRDTGLKVHDVFVVCIRGSKGWDKWTKSLGVDCYSFCSIPELVNYLKEINIISHEAWQLLTWYNQFPNKWQQDPKKMAYLKNYKKQKHRTSKSGI